MKFGLLGRHLKHSYSPEIHQELHGEPYALYEKEPEEVESFLRETDLDGLNVTIPYKQTVMKSCVWLSDAARRIGCVNTLKKMPDGWHGYNTDYYGFGTMLKEAAIDPAGLKCLILGNGGASLTARTALQDLGAREVVILSRSKAAHESSENDPGQASEAGPGAKRSDAKERSPESCSVTFDTYDHLERHKDAGLIVNTTPVGMYPENGTALLDPADFPDLKGVADVVYNPARTELLLRAERESIPYAGGLHMLVAQAKKSAEIWLDRAIPDSEVLRIRKLLEAKMQNIILIGMPGCGKSSIGKILSEMTGRPFIDADEELIRMTKRPIPEIFAEEGETAFRRYETKVLSELGKRSGCIISTGGGCITREENYPLLHQNGRIIWIRRDLKVLPSEGRPLSQLHTMEALYEARKDAYQRFADVIVENDKSVESAAERILRLQYDYNS